MDKILELFSEKHIIDLFRDKILPLYPDFVGIKSIKIHAYKKYIWGDSYHVVAGYDVIATKSNGQIETLPIFCSAHSEENRESVYKALKFLWDNGFNDSQLSIPHPLFYSPEFNGTFYRGAEGKNLYRFIRVKKFKEIEEIIPQAAAWFAKLHGLAADKGQNFNPVNSRIRTVMPGVEHILERIKIGYPEHSHFYEKVYEKFMTTEEAFLDSSPKRWLVHGDAHPENIIRMSEDKVAVIDFTDLCFTDFARDLGAFTQQLEYMCNRKIKDQAYAEKVKKMFLDSYFLKSSEKLTPELQARINLYYNWTTIRTATHFLIKHEPEPERAKALIAAVEKRMEKSL